LRAQDIVEVLKSHRRELSRRFFVKRLGLFGSFVRGEERPDSDIDILVEFYRPVSLFKFLELEDYLSELLGRRVDLVSRGALKPGIGKRIMKEVFFIEQDL
jgi:predicted nucleotidyltransferase